MDFDLFNPPSLVSASASPALASAPPELPSVIASSVKAGPPPTPSAGPGGPGLKQSPSQPTDPPTAAPVDDLTPAAAAPDPPTPDGTEEGERPPRQPAKRERGIGAEEGPARKVRRAEGDGGAGGCQTFDRAKGKGQGKGKGKGKGGPAGGGLSPGAQRKGKGKEKGKGPGQKQVLGDGAASGGRGGTPQHRIRAGNLFSPMNQNQRKVYVGNIRHGTTAEELTECLTALVRQTQAALGRPLDGSMPVVEDVAIVDSTKKNIAFAFVTLRTVVMANDLLVASPEAVLGGRRLKLKRAAYAVDSVYPLGCDVSHIPTHAEGPTMFMGGIPSDVRPEQVLMVLGEYGPVTAFRLVTHEWGESRGYAFFQFEDHANHAKIEVALNGWKLGPKRNLTVHPSNQAQANQPKPVQEVCMAYRKGQCRGVGCPNLHEGDIRLPTRLCPKLGTGECEDGARCPLAHVTAEIPCRFFASMSCKNGSDCQYCHDIPCYELVLDEKCPRGDRCPFWHNVPPGQHSGVVKEYRRWQVHQRTFDVALQAYLDRRPAPKGPPRSSPPAAGPTAVPAAADAAVAERPGVQRPPEEAGAAAAVVPKVEAPPPTNPEGATVKLEALEMELEGLDMKLEAAELKLEMGDIKREALDMELEADWALATPSLLTKSEPAEDTAVQPLRTFAAGAARTVPSAVLRPAAETAAPPPMLPPPEPVVDEDLGWGEAL